MKRHGRHSRRENARVLQIQTTDQRLTVPTQLKFEEGMLVCWEKPQGEKKMELFWERIQ